VITKGAVVTY